MAKQEYKSAVRSKIFIKHALMNLVAKKDFEKITVTEVIDTSGISRGTFYSHYKSLDDVINQIIDDEYNRLVRIIGEHCEIYSNPYCIFALISNVFKYLEKRYSYCCWTIKFAVEWVYTAYSEYSCRYIQRIEFIEESWYFFYYLVRRCCCFIF